MITAGNYDITYENRKGQNDEESMAPESEVKLIQTAAVFLARQMEA